MKKLDALTSLRFFAALAIVVHHSKAAFEMTAWIESPIPLDYGVSFFFVLSGFILTYSYPESQHKTELRSFYVARFARIWPLHFTTFALCLILVPQHGRLSPNSVDTMLINLALLQAWIPMAGYYFSYNAVSWSISAELFFYLCFPFLARRLAETWRWKAFAVGGLLIAVLTLSVQFNAPPYDPKAPFVWSSTGLAYISPFARLFEFFLGMLTAILFMKLKNSINFPTWIWTAFEVGAMFLVPCALIGSKFVTSLFGVTPSGSSPIGEYLAHAGGAPAFAVIVFVLAFGKGWVSRALSWRVLVVLGEASFALYLLHQILISWYFMSLPVPEQIPNWAWCIIYWVGCVGGSLLLWHYVETPCRKIIRRSFTARSTSSKFQS